MGIIFFFIDFKISGLGKICPQLDYVGEYFDHSTVMHIFTEHVRSTMEGNVCSRVCPVHRGRVNRFT